MKGRKGMKSTYYTYIKRNILRIMAVIFFGNILWNAVSLCQIPIYKQAITYLLNDGDEWGKEKLFLAAAMLIVVYLVSIFFLQYFHPAFLVHCKEHMRKEYIGKIIKYPVYEFENKTNGEFIVNYDNLEDVTDYIFDYVSLITSIATIVTLIIYIMHTVHWELVVFLIGMVFILFFIQGITQILQNKQEEIINKEEKIVELLDSGVKNIEILKCFQYEDDFERSFDGHVEELYNVQKRKNMVSNMIEMVQQLSKVVVMLGTPLFCFILEQKNIVKPSAVIVASFSFFIIANSFVEVITSIRNIAEKKQKFIMLDGFFSCTDEKNTAYQINSKESLLTLNDVTIQNGDSTILENCTMQFPRFGVVAIYGQSGIGKSSLLKVIAGQKKLNGGQIIYCDEQKKMISYAPQESILFLGSLFENLKFAKDGITSQEISKIAKQLNVEDRILELKNGFFTMIESEKDLSGGQRQIINLCRAFLKPASVVLLDEPTSSQSSDMEDKILQGIKAISAEKLCVIVTHSDKVKKIADLTYVIQEKKLKRVSGE